MPIEQNSINSRTLTTNQSSIKYWWMIFKISTPEILSAALLVFLPIAFDLYFISSLKNTSSFRALSISSNVIHLACKMSECASTAVATKVGLLNGAGKLKSAGNLFFNSIIAAVILGSLQVFIIFITSNYYCTWMGAHPAAVPLIKKFLITQSFAIMLSFVFMCLVGFFRGIKNSWVPLLANIVAVVSFLLFDYLLIFGKLGLPALGLQGSAYASIIRYFTATAFLLGFLFFSKEMDQYFSKTNLNFDPHASWEIIKFSIPIMIDKSVIAISYIWLYKIIIPLSAYSVLAMEVVKNLERFLFVPAQGLAQVTNTLLSNRIGKNDYNGAWDDLRNILSLAIGIVTSLLIIFIIKAKWLVSIFDPTNLFQAEAVFILRCVSGFVILDVCQIIFASALRAASCVYTVMLTRSSLFLFLYLPLSLILRKTSFTDSNYKFLAYYGSFYLTISLIGVYFLYKTFQVLGSKVEDRKASPSAQNAKS